MTLFCYSWAISFASSACPKILRKHGTRKLINRSIQNHIFVSLPLRTVEVVYCSWTPVQVINLTWLVLIVVQTRAFGTHQTNTPFLPRWSTIYIALAKFSLTENHFDLEKLFKVVISRGNGTKLWSMKRVIRLILNFSKGSYSIFGSHWDLENSSGRMRENSNFQISNKAFCKRWKEMKYSWFWNEQRNV